MATSGLYGNTAANVTALPSGSETSGLYGNNTVFGGTYFEWFVFQASNLQPATPTGGAWDFTTNIGTPPTGWSSAPPANPTATVWVSIALVNSRTASTLTWSVPGKFSYSSGLPILSGTGAPSSGLGVTDQLYIQTDTTPESIWFNQVGTWTKLTGSTLYADLTSNQTIAGTKTFSSQIQGSVSGTAANVTGIVAVGNGGTGVTTSTGSGSVVLNTGASLGRATVSDYETFTSVAAPTYTEGRLWYDSTQKALTYNSDISGNSLHVGQETQLKVRNGTGSTIAKGAPVYITSTATGVSFPNIALAKADTLTTGNCIGLTNEAIASGADGYVVINGLLNGVNTGTFTVGDVLYVSPYSAGQLMNTFPPTGYPVKIGVVSFVNSSTGSIYINQSNAFVQASSVIGTLSIANGGTGTATPALVAGTNVTITGTWPNQTINSTNGGGTVTSVAATVPSFLSVTGSPITTSGTLGITYSGTALPVANGGTGVTTSTGTGSVVLSTSPTLVTPALGTPSALVGTNITGTAAGLSIGGNAATATNVAYSGLTGTVPTWNQNTTGNAATATTATNVSGGTASVTTLTASSTVTLSGGTANGVAYLNGSKVVTTGSALTFDGTAFQNSVSASGEIFRIVGTGSGTYTTSIFQNTNAGGYVQQVFNVGTSGASGQAAIQYAPGLFFSMGTVANDSTTPLTWKLNGSEQMRLTSTGLGIGTSSPSELLTVAGQIGSRQNINSAANVLVVNSNAGASANARFRLASDVVVGNLQANSNAATPQLALVVEGAYPLTFYTTNTERMRLDSSGNLGIGTSSPSAVLHTSSGAVTNSIFATTRASGAFIQYALGASGATIGYVGSAGQLTSGATADFSVRAESNLIFASGSGTERMRLDSSGNLGLGVTPSLWYQGSGVGKAIQIGSSTALYDYSATGNVQTRLYNNAYLNTAGTETFLTTNGATKYFQGSSTHSWFVAPSGTAGTSVSFTQAMTLDASGLLTVGATSPAGSSQITAYGASNGQIAVQNSTNWSRLLQNSNDLYIDNGVGGSAGNIIFRNSSSTVERARIDSSGNLLVGLTSALANGKIQVAGSIGLSGNTQIRQATNSDGNTLQFFGTQFVASTANSGSYSYSGGGLVAPISTGDGTLLIDAGFATSTYGRFKVANTVSPNVAMSLEKNGVYTLYANTGSNTLSIGATTSNAKLNVVTGLSGSYGSAGIWLSDNATTSMLINNVSSGLSAIWSSGAIAFGAANNNFTENMRLDTAGNLLVGTTSLVYGFAGNVQSYAPQYNYLAAGPAGSVTCYAMRMVNNSAGTVVGSITYTSSGTLYNVTSDQRLKENIVDAPEFGSVIDSIQVRSFDWKTDNTHQRAGFVAQELVTVAPEAVHQPADPEEMMAVDYSKLVPMLVKEIQDLRKRLAAAGI